MTADSRAITLRPPSRVMRLERMGCFHQTRLSFMRSLLRLLAHQGWRFSRIRWEVDSKGVGLAVYRATGPERCYSLVCFAHDLPPEKRSDRVIATAWDATFTLFDGIPDQDDIDRLEKEVPLQEAGHCSQTELVLARANRSVRLFEHVVQSLASGKQPDRKQMEQVGYLMRTTAVYGNGKFGISDRERIASRPEFSAPFHCELLTVWLIRWFTVEIAEHLARAAGGDRAVTMDPELRRHLGVGNSTGLGMAPFLILHPALIHRWIMARETALLRVRRLERGGEPVRERFVDLVLRMQAGVRNWRTVNERQRERIVELERDLDRLYGHVVSGGIDRAFPWDSVVRWSERNLSMEGQELLVTLVIEPHADLVDDLSGQMGVDEDEYFPIDGSMPLSRLQNLIERNYRWALDIDYREREQSARFWYYSEEKLEPRVGERYEEPGADKEHPLAYGRDVKRLARQLGPFMSRHGDSVPAARFLCSHPEHRHSVRRVQVTSVLEYAEIRDNLVGADMVPVDLLRCKLSFFGASRFDPRSDRWVRINMYQYAPFPDECDLSGADDWVYPRSA